MSIDGQNFRSWFGDVLANLYENHHAGFAVVMVAFPILERYLRQKTNLTQEQSLSDAFYDELRVVFSELSSGDMARQFWSVYRNGILHQVTFSSKSRKQNPLPNGVLSYDVNRLTIDHRGNFFMNPVAFAKQVVEVVEANFSTFEGTGNSSAPPLPVVHRLPVAGNTEPSGAPVYVLGTGVRPHP